MRRSITAHGRGGAGRDAPIEQPDSAVTVERVGDVAVVRDAAEGPRVIDLDTPPAAASRPGLAGFLYRAVGLCLAGSDILCLAAALFLAQMPSLPFEPSLALRLGIVVVACALWIGAFAAFDLYSPQRLSPPEIFRRIISATSVGILLLVVLSLGSRVAPSRLTVGATWGLALVFELATRRVWAWWLYHRRRDGSLTYRTLIVGAGPEASAIGRVLQNPGLGFSVLGYVGVAASRDQDEAGIVGDVDTLPRLIEAHGVDCLFVAATEATVNEVAYARQVARERGAEVRVSAMLPGTLTSRLTLLPIGDVTAISLKPVYLSGPQAAVKRAFDLLVSAGALLVLSPLLAVVAVGIKLTSRGPVLFKQERITTGGRNFVCYKFRTMVEDANRLLEEESQNVSSAFFKPSDDFPITRFGRGLRRWSIDELPQLWNVVRGDMSLVGPRPLPVEQVNANLEMLEYRHAVRAGMTGWWQINGRSDVVPEEAVRMDLFYIENWSVTLDLYIVLKTIGALLTRRGAY